MHRTGLVVVLIGSLFLAGWAGRTADAPPEPRPPAASPAHHLDLGLVTLYREPAHTTVDAWSNLQIGARAPLGLVPATRPRGF